MIDIVMYGKRHFGVCAINRTGRSIEIVGIRPGEKLHEELITTTDALNTVEFNDYYVILPSAKPNWSLDKFKTESNSTLGNMCELGFSYNSETNKTFLTVENLKKLILDPKKL